MSELTLESFIERAQQIHGNKYDYTKTDLKHRSNHKVIVTCPIHGDWYVTPSEHIRAVGKASGCPGCAKHKRYTKEDVRKRAEMIHGDKYDYSMIDIEHRDRMGRVTVICKKHGAFMITPNNLLRGHGCPRCAPNLKYTTDSYIAKATQFHNGRYTYPGLQYTNISDRITIQCPVHGPFKQKASYHILGHGCPKCNPSNKSNRDEFIKKAKTVHGARYDYSRVKYVNSTTPVTIICPQHGEFSQGPNNHLNGQGCPKCVQSKLENMVRVALNKRGIIFSEQKSFEGLRTKRLLKYDFFLPEHNTLIECQGEQHFKPIDTFGGENAFKAQKIRDQMKSDYCKSHNIRLIYFAECTFNPSTAIQGEYVNTIDELIGTIIPDK